MIKSFIEKLILKGNPLKHGYDLDTLKGIDNIPIPKYKHLQGMGNPSNNIEYILQKKATEHKKNGRMDLAIACLRKANEIFPHSNFSWAEKDYMRLVEYLKADRQFDEARKEEAKIKELFTKFNQEQQAHNDRKHREIYGNTDIVSTNDTSFVCEECAKYTKRYFSISGNSKRYPKLPEYLLHKSSAHKYCAIELYPVLDNISEPAWNYKGDFIKYCNRPFIDERTKEQKAFFEKEVKEKEDSLKDKEFYDLIFEKFPDIAPKSFGGFRRMKAANSDNYKKLLQKANELLGYDFYEKK